MLRKARVYGVFKLEAELEIIELDGGLAIKTLDKDGKPTTSARLHPGDKIVIPFNVEITPEELK